MKSLIDFETRRQELVEMENAEKDRISLQLKDYKDIITGMENELECLYVYQRKVVEYFEAFYGFKDLEKEIMKLSKANKDTSELTVKLNELNQQYIQYYNQSVEFANMYFVPIFLKYLNLCAQLIVDEHAKNNGTLPSVLTELGLKIQQVAPYLKTTQLWVSIKDVNERDLAIQNIKIVRECIIRVIENEYDKLNDRKNDLSDKLHGISNAISQLDKFVILEKQKNMVDRIESLQALM